MIFEVTDMITPSCACIATNVNATPPTYCASVYSNGEILKSTITRQPIPAKAARNWSSTLLIYLFIVVVERNEGGTKTCVCGAHIDVHVTLFEENSSYKITQNAKHRKTGVGIRLLLIIPDM